MANLARRGMSACWPALNFRLWRFQASQLGATQFHCSAGMKVGSDCAGPYSMDLRQLAMDRLAAGEASDEVTAALKVAVLSVIKWAQRQRVAGSATPLKWAATAVHSRRPIATGSWPRWSALLIRRSRLWLADGVSCGLHMIERPTRLRGAPGVGVAEARGARLTSVIAPDVRDRQLTATRPIRRWTADLSPMSGTGTSVQHGVPSRSVHSSTRLPNSECPRRD